MKKLIVMITMMAVSIVVAAPLTVTAGQKKAKSEVVMKMGNKLHLFHGGNVEAQKEIAIGDVLLVYREYYKSRLPKEVPARAEKEVGEVKVLSFIGEHYFEAEIVKGEIKISDIAKKDATSLLVQPAK